MRQDSAGKLANCFCDGTEDFECEEIRENTDNLCFEKEKDNENVTIVDDEVQESTGIMKKGSLVVVISILCSVLNTTLGESIRKFIEDLCFKP